MPVNQSKQRTAAVGECRRCSSFCDKLVEPRGCIELGCRYLYSYVDALTGTQYVGCMQKVFNAEGSGRAYDCVNPRFFDCTDEGPEGLRAFDLRDRLQAA